MMNYKYISPKTLYSSMKINIYIINFLLFSNLIPIYIAYEDFVLDHILIFNHSKFKAGNFAKNKKGELFIEYYSVNDNIIPTSRLFYGWQKNGRELFFKQSSYTQEINIDIDKTKDISGYYNNFDIYDSKNLFVSIKNEHNQANQYLFSINSYDSMIELHKFSNNINTVHYLWNFHDFFKTKEEKYRFPYEIVLLELKKESSYIIAFIPKIYVNENMNGLSFIKKFRFKAFNEDAYEEIKSIEYNNYINKRIVSAFLMDDNFLVVISLEENEEDKDNIDEISENSLFKINIHFYYLNNLDIFEAENNNILNIPIFPPYIIDDLFFKAIYLRKGFTVFIWISFDYNFFLNLELCKLSYSSRNVIIEQKLNNFYYLFLRFFER